MTSIMISDSSPAAAAAAAAAGMGLPALVHNTGDRAGWRFIDFFLAEISNVNTRMAYYRAVSRFLDWCESVGFESLEQVRTRHVATYDKLLRVEMSDASVKQHLAGVRRFFDWMATGGVLDSNPAAAVRGPKMVLLKGKTPVLEAEQMRELLDSLPLDEMAGVRDRALLGVMVYTFGRVGAVVGMDVEDYYLDGRRPTFRLKEKGGKLHMVPAHHNAIEYVGDYLDAAGLEASPKVPLFQTVGWRGGSLTGKRMPRQSVWQMIKRRAREAGLPMTTGCHTMRATGITAYLDNGGSLEHARKLAAHASSQTTRLYDHSEDRLSLDEIERIRI